MRDYVIHTNFIQGSEEWDQIRLGRVGGISCATLLAGNGIDPNRECCPECNSVSISYRKTSQDWRCSSCKTEGFDPIRYGDSQKANALSEGAVSMAYRKVGELATGPIESFSNQWTDRGTDLEPLARERYEQETFTHVTQVGYISVGEWLGVSPDSIVPEDGRIVGGIEIKCPCAEKYLRFLDRRELDPEYDSQCQWFMWITGAEWIDFVMFHPDFKQDIIIERQYPDPQKFEIWDRKVPILIAEMVRIKKLAQI